MAVVNDELLSRAIGRLRALGEHELARALSNVSVRSASIGRPLTVRQRQVYDYVVGYIAEHGHAPTQGQIGSALGLASLATVNEHLANIELKGWIRRRFNEASGIELVAVGGA